jgi:hypothetical protein
MTPLEIAAACALKGFVFAVFVAVRGDPEARAKRRMTRPLRAESDALPYRAGRWFRSLLRPDARHSETRSKHAARTTNGAIVAADEILIGLRRVN